VSSLLTTTRASDAYADNTSGVWSLFASGSPRLTDKGLLPEETRTNVVLYNRDLTNGAWTPTNVTVAKDQTGIDGVANSASSLTATAGNGTVLQAITLSSSARWQTCFIKRITGTGNIDMTMDNGSTWTTLTVTSAWTRVAIPTQTLANPTVGFRIVTSGDAVAVDFVQNENSGVFATSPIAVTGSSATRAADNIQIANIDWLTQGRGTFYVEGMMPTAPNTNRFALHIWDGTTNNDIRLYLNSASKLVGEVNVGGANKASLTSSNTITVGSTYKAAIAYDTDTFIEALNGTLSNEDTSGTVPTVTAAQVGRFSSGSFTNNGYIRRVAYFPTRLPNAQLQAITA